MILSGLTQRAAYKGTYSLDSDDFLSFLGLEAKSLAGVEVTEERVAQLSAFYRGVDLLSDVIGLLPVHVLRKEGDRRVEVEHPLTDLWTLGPNSEMTGFAYRKFGQKSMMMQGAHPAEIQFGGDGSLRGLKPLGQSSHGLGTYRPIRPRRRNKVIVFDVPQEGGGTTIAYRDEIFYSYKWSRDGLTGLSVIEQAREQWGISIAVENFAARTFGQGIFPSLLLKAEKSFKDEPQRERVRRKLEKLLAGGANSHRVGFLEQGLEPVKDAIHMKPEDAQLLLARNHSVEEIARYLGMPVHLLALERPYQMNIGAQAAEFGRYTVHPWVKVWEAEANARLLTPKERKEGLRVHISLRGLLRGDQKEQGEWYQLMRQLGVYSADDVRQYEDLDPLPEGHGGGDYWRPINYLAVSDEESEEEAAAPSIRAAAPSLRTKPERRSLEARLRIRESFLPLLEAQAGRLVSREVGAIRKAVDTTLLNQGPDAFLDWLDDFFEGHAAYGVRIMAPVLASLQQAIAGEAAVEIGFELEQFAAQVESTIAAYGEAFGDRHAAIGRDQLRSLVAADGDEEQPADPATAVKDRLDRWQENRSEQVAESEVVRAAEMIALAVWGFAGIPKTRWHWGGGDCTICPAMHGREVPTGQAFGASGDQLPLEGDAPDFVFRHTTTHPPVHSKCKCTLEPVS